MLHPLQLKDVSMRYAVEIAELQGFLSKSGIRVETSGAIASIATRLRQEDTFHRDLTLHVWAIFHAPGKKVSYADAMAMLAVAAAGPVFAAEGADRDAHELLRFLMEASNSFDASSFDPGFANTRPEAAREQPAVVPTELNAVQAVRIVQSGAEWHFEPAINPEIDNLPSFATEEDGGRHRLLWGGIAVCALFLLCLGLWLHFQPSGVNNATETAPTSSANPEEAETSAPAVLPTYSSLPTAAAGAERHTHTAAARTEIPHNRATTRTVPANPAPQNTAPHNSSASVAPAAERPSIDIPAARIPAAPARVLPHPDVHPDSTQQAVIRDPLTKTSRSNAPVYRGSDAPIAVLYTPVVRSTTLGNMAANFTRGSVPQYPTAAVDQHVQGVVRLEAEVDRTGNVVSTRVVSGPALLQEAALHALQSWQYRPYLYEGKPIAVNATVVMDFQLQ